MNTNKLINRLRTLHAVRWALCGLALVFGLGAHTAAQADRWTTTATEATTRHQTVSTRPRPIYDALGIPAGGFLILPSLGVTETYDSNIYLESNNGEDDFITSVRPQVRAVSRWSNHQLTAGAGVDAKFYADNSDENNVDFYVRSSGRLDIQRGSNLFGGASYNGLHEARGDPDSPAAARDPVSYRLLNANVGGIHTFNRISVSIEGDLASYDYSNATNATTGAPIIQNTRDRDQYRLTGRIAYEVQPQYKIFVQGSGNRRDYDRLAAGGFDRASDGYEVVVGSDMDLGGLVFGSVFAGYRSQDYDDPRLKTISGATAGARLNWNVTRLTTVSGTLDRSVNETTIGSASGSFVTSMRVGVNHELMRNVLLNAHLRGSRTDYEGISREDDLYEFGMGGQYLVNRYGRVGLNYVVSRRDSDAVGADYTDHKVMLNGRLQF